MYVQSSNSLLHLDCLDLILPNYHVSTHILNSFANSVSTHVSIFYNSLIITKI
ncbi:hypothetical protein GIB67_017829 [Kingdonia uniflora]|uniref:Uncharacterized protein n=1 Tax=Kingdonia uniflora TaxID=39325 RepID=A0A7J7MP76_9MAGN|nr:hypothetical protein GIB67_017829 [Kingdonia uniflora]